MGLADRPRRVHGRLRPDGRPGSRRGRQRLRGSFHAVIADFPDIAAQIAGTRLLHTATVRRYDGFLRESAGQGWVLVGDAGHVKDPTPAQDISDAFRQVERLAPAIVSGLARGPAELDSAVTQWWAWRDDDAIEEYWWATDLGASDELPALARQVMRSVGASGSSRDAHIEILGHRRRPSQVLTKARIVRALLTLLVRGDAPRRQVIEEFRFLAGVDAERHRLQRRPTYVDPESARRPTPASDERTTLSPASAFKRKP